MWKIVIVDDDRKTLQGMRRTIPWRELGAELVGQAMDGEEGWKLVREKRPDIVMTDIYMPVLNGLDMIERLRKDGFQGKVVILSGYSDFEYARQALRLNVDDYLSKPVTVRTLKDVLGKAAADLERRRAERTEAEELRRKLLLYEPFVENEWVKSVVTGSSAANIGQSPPLFARQNDWENSAFLVMALEIARSDRIDAVSIRDWNLFRFAVGNIVQELVQSEWEQFHFVELHSRYMAVLLQTAERTDEASVRERAIRLGARLIGMVDAFLRIRLQVGLGMLKRDWRNISDSTEEAFQALAMKRCAPDTQVPVFVYKRKHAQEGTGQAAGHGVHALRPIRFYQAMADAIRHFSEEAALQALSDFIPKLKELAELSADDVRHVGAELWAIIMYALHEAGLPLSEACTETDVRRELEAIVTPEQLEKWATDKIRAICARYERSENIKHKRAVDFMIRYIHEHYAEDIRLGDLAEKVYISRNYLSGIFRSATGETFNDYVTRVRMEKAKRMLAEGKYMIYEISEKVGYKNVPYFTTLFKKYTGRIPTDFLRCPAEDS